MNRPVLDSKIEKAHEILRNAPIDTDYSFVYKGELHTLTKIGEFEDVDDNGEITLEPLFVWVIEERGDWHEPI